ncbi:MAG: universal stress protein [Thermoleophilia bacterium]|nr:universal stress protein [Thermoleophilia bacterium]
MPYRKILLATDGSEQALKAAAQAAQLATACRTADLQVLGVAVEYAPLKGRNPFMQAMETEAERAVETTAQVVAEHGVTPIKVVRLATGNPGHTICEVAREVGADLIVMGSRGHGPAASLLIGSTSMHVVHCSPIPVLLVR